MIDIDELEKFLSEATPGMWGVCSCQSCGLVWSESGHDVLADFDVDGISPARVQANRAAVVVLRNVAPALLAELREVRARVAELENLYAEADARANLYEGLLSVESSTSAKLRARVAELEAAARPIPVTKRLPEINVSILARVKGRKAFMQAQLTPRNTWRVWGGEYAFDSVTHWLPMPEV